MKVLAIVILVAAPVALWIASASAVPTSAAADVSHPPSPADMEILRRQTQEMMDSLVPGGSAIWDRYLDPAAVVTTEDGEVVDKAKLVGDIKPMPAGVSGMIVVTEFRAMQHGDTVVATHLDDEHERFHGHELHCQYRTTDTWVRSPLGWRLLASQILAVRTDPPAVPLASRLRDEYCGHYTLSPAISYDIRCKGDAMEGEETGRKPQVLLAEAPDVLFVPGRPRYRDVILRDASGRVTGFAERREAWSLLWQRADPPAAAH